MPSSAAVEDPFFTVAGAWSSPPDETEAVLDGRTCRKLLFTSDDEQETLEVWVESDPGIVLKEEFRRERLLQHSWQLADLDSSEPDPGLFVDAPNQLFSRTATATE
jgi:hypothetical protein